MWGERICVRTEIFGLSMEMMVEYFLTIRTTGTHIEQGGSYESENAYY